METCLIFGSTEIRFSVGEVVENFGHIARVLRIESDGSLYVREIGKRTEWVADPEKCRIVR